MRTPLLKGRYFTDADVSGNAKVVVISDELARLYFAGEDPVGRRPLRGSLGKEEALEIIGVLDDVRHCGVDIGLRQMVYAPSLFTNLVIRTTKAGH